MEQNEPTMIVEETTILEKKDRFLPVSILIAAVVLGGSIVFASIYHPAGSGAAQNGGNNGGTTATLSTAEIMKLSARDVALGSATAPVTMIEYGDYQCPFCGLFFSQTESQIVQNYVSTGKVKLVYRDFPFLGPESISSAEAAECAQDQNKLWPYHDALFKAKAADASAHPTTSENNGFFNRAFFLQIAQNLNMDISMFTSCIDGHKNADLVTEDSKNANAAGVNSTPVFFINGTQVVGAQPYAQFKQVIDAALAAH